MKAETRNGPTGAPPRRPRTSLGASGVLGFVLVLVLFVLVGDCGGDPSGQDPAASPVSAMPGDVVVAALVLPGYTSDAIPPE